MSNWPFDDDVAGLLAADARHLVVAEDEEAATPPPELRQRLLAGALARRPGGRPTGPWAAERISPVEALRRSQAELHGVLSSLDRQEWERPAPTARAGWRARDVVAHLVAVEAYFAALLGEGDWAPPPGSELDHLGMTEPTVAAMAERPAEEVLARWRAAVERALRRLEQLEAEGRLAERVTFVGLQLPVSALTVVRVFEVWTHTEDVLRATGRPLSPPDGSRLALMTDLAVRSIPFGMELAGRRAAGRSVRVVLTGPGGGAWTAPLALGSPAGEPDLVVVADAVDFCRLAAKRVAPGELACVVSGEESLLDDVLEGAAVFAA